MHRTRLGTIVIDCDDMERGVSFWSRALGAEVKKEDETYVSLGQVAGGLRVLIQRVPEGKSAKARIHLDIETDNVDAEMARLKELGATVQRQEEDWCVMEDPCGNEFCVIPPETEGFPERTRTWA
ncbi:MAG: VOC family protein [Dehalococcoidia bacterium]